MLGELADSLVTGVRALPSRLLAAGFQFRHSTLAEALRSTVNQVASAL
jgi:NAD dependent epimerase/dehydratase family enzyme